MLSTYSHPTFVYSHSNTYGAGHSMTGVPSEKSQIYSSPIQITTLVCRVLYLFIYCAGILLHAFVTLQRMAFMYFCNNFSIALKTDLQANVSCIIEELYGKHTIKPVHRPTCIIILTSIFVFENHYYSPDK